MKVELRPGVTNSALWYPERRRAGWESIRKHVLSRDDFCCQCCGHRALKGMNLHNLTSSDDNSSDNLATICVACHAIMHLGRSLSFGSLAVYEANGITQVQIVQQTRAGVASGKALEEINKTFKLKEGKYPPNSIQYANELLDEIGSQPWAWLEERLCAVFVKFKSWQLEETSK